MKFTTVIAAAVLAFTASATPVVTPLSSCTFSVAGMTQPAAPPGSTSTAPPGSTTTAVAAEHAYTTSTVAEHTTSASAHSSSTSGAPPPPPAATATAHPGGMSLTTKLTIADSAVDRFALIPDDKDFVFNFSAKRPAAADAPHGAVVAANRKTFPALVSTGAGMAVGFLEGCAFNTPHVHPRSVELQIVTAGRLVVEMVPENGVFRNNDAKQGRRVITNTIGVNEMTPFYLGSVHAQFNPDCTPATFVAAFNNEDFGTGQVADELFAMTDDVVGGVFGQTIAGADIDKFRKAISPSLAKGVETCLKTCGIKKR